MGLGQLIEALPAAAASPFAFASYVILVVAWVVVAFRVKRNKALLKNLQKLPEHDRLNALRLEMHGVELKEGISPEQWIRSKTHNYIFLGFMAICFVIVIIGVVLIKQQKSDLSPYPILDVNLGNMDHERWIENTKTDDNWVMDSSVGLGNVLIPFRVGKDSKNLFSYIQNQPNNIYLIRISGSSIDTGFRVTNESISLEFNNCSFDDGHCEWGIVLHFSPSDSIGGWNTFEEGILTASDNYFSLVGFFRFSRAKQKMELYKNYRTKAVVPESKRAEITLKLLDDGDFKSLFSKHL